MNTVSKYKVWIGPYLRGELSDLKKKEFELALEANKELKNEYLLQKDIADTINRKSEFDNFK